MAEINKRNLIKSKYPEADCRQVKALGQSYYIVYLHADMQETTAIGKNPSQAWALAYERLKKEGRVE